MSTVDRLAVGDRVWVDDPGLQQLRQIMRSFGEDVPPNHHGTIAEVWDDSYLIYFDDGAGAPYPHSDVHPLVTKEQQHG